MSASETTTPKKPVLPHVRSKEHRVVFTNMFTLSAGDNEVSMTCSVENQGAAVGPEQAHLDEVTIVMTPRTLKIMSISLSNAISYLESRKGPIPLEPSKIEEINRLMEQAQKAAEVRKGQNKDDK